MLADKMGRKKLFDLCTVLSLFLFKDAYCTMTTLKADIFMSSIRGSVVFSNQSGTDPVGVTFNLTGLNSDSSYFWNIHTFSVNYDTADRCNDESIGNSWFPSLAGTNQNIPLNMTSTTDFQTDLKSLLGRSVVLKEGETAVACATILPEKPLISAVVNFRSFIVGRVILRQPLDSDQSESILYTDLYYMDGRPEDLNYNWEIRSNPVDESGPVENLCKDLGTLFGTSSTEGCGQQNQTSCSIGSLGSKLGQTKVASRKGSQRSVYIDANLPLSGNNSVIGKSMVILAQNGDILACANIHGIKEKKVSAVFNDDGVTGGIIFSQKSPFDPTIVEVKLSGLNNNAGGYHVHNFPVPAKLDIDSFVCGGDTVSGHWNPFSVNTTTGLLAGNGTSDQYEVGDLSGKYGTLVLKNSLMNTYTDWNLPLFGRNSIVGRSIVIHHPNTSRWICTNIGYPSNVLTAQAIFRHPVIGQMMLRQVENDPFSDTSVFIELNRADGIQETRNHNFHVHVSPIEFDIDVNTSCEQAGGHFNPFTVNTANLYSTLCSPVSPLLCEIGDMSSKHSRIDIVASKNISTKYFFTDSSLPLSGPLSIIGRSIVIHAAERASPRIACANLYEQTPLEAIVNQWSPGPVSGSIKFVQATSFDKTKVNVELNGLEATAGGYHIHVFPLLPGVQSPCSAGSVSGHFDPFNISKTIKSPEAGTGTFDKYEVGDLSGKYGRLTDKMSLSGNFTDNNLPMRGRQSIVGRSVVIHKEKENARWVCGNINENLLEKPSAVLYRAQAIFKGGIQGSIMLSQVHYADGNLGDTQVYINLQNSDSSITKGHPWHIHENPISMLGDCTSASKHYNPYAVNVDENYDECHPLNPLRCELGDLSGKHGKYDIGSGPKFYTDVNIPLSEKYSVLGRSIVIHAPGGARIACADIMAMDAEVVQMQVSRPRPSFDKKDFMAAIANLLKSPHWKIGVLVHDDGVQDDSDRCLKVSTYITGPDSVTYKEKLNKFIAEEPGLLGIYAPCTADASSINMSISVLLFLLTLNWISS